MNNTAALNGWWGANGDNTHRLDYNLNSASLIFDLGGYTGDWTQKMVDKYKCSSYIFEPVLGYYNIIKDRFKNNNNIKCFDYGISDNSEKVNIHYNKDASSIYIKNGDLQEIQLKSINEFLKEQNIKMVDLAKINIEGSEYNLLESLIEHKNQTKFKNLQIQFHEIDGDYINRRLRIRDALSKTHRETYNYEFVWENWELK